MRCMISIFDEFIGKEVKAPYRDGEQFKIARGTLIQVKDGFVKIRGSLGTIVIKEERIEKMSENGKVQ
mgnify:FL=1